MLHAEVSTSINVNVARSEDEAERQARGENVLAKADDTDAGDEEASTDDNNAEFFDEEAQAAVASDETAEQAEDKEA